MGKARQHKLTDRLCPHVATDLLTHLAPVPWDKAGSGAMATGVKYGWYASNCNCCRRYHWRSVTCQRQGRVKFANTPPCGGQDYQSFAPALAEHEAGADAIREGAS